jgi:hypothetical protein
MIWTPENTSKAGNRVDRVLDADGIEIDGMITLCDTVTGVIERYVANEKGKPSLAPCGTKMQRETLQFKAPLQVIFAGA